MTSEELNKLLRDYYWMMNIVKEQHEINNYVSISVSKFGLESITHSTNGNNSDPIHADFVRRSKRVARAKHYEEKLLEIQQMTQCITDYKQREIIDWTLDGRGTRWIGRKMGMTHTNVIRIKNQAIETMLGFANEKSAS